jgi:3'(2'), 5'-bisphosphate nucleotidase
LSPVRDIPPAEAVRLLPELTAIVARASAVILELSAGMIAHRLKPDQSPVTVADEASEAEILHGLAQLLPGVPVIAEEMSGRQAAPALAGSFLMVDPLDGTKEFLAGSDEFTINVAIISGGAPIAGIVAAPKRGQIWRGIVGTGAERLRLTPDGAAEPQPIHTRRWPPQDAVATMSRSHLDPSTQAFLDRLGPLTRRPSGSAIKFCHIADGAVDVYPRLATTCEWDVAAGHALLTAAGGVVTAPDGSPLPYGRVAANFRVPGFIAWGDVDKAKSILSKSSAG